MQQFAKLDGCSILNCPPCQSSRCKGTCVLIFFAEERQPPTLTDTKELLHQCLQGKNPVSVPRHYHGPEVLGTRFLFTKCLNSIMYSVFPPANLPLSQKKMLIFSLVISSILTTEQFLIDFPTQPSFWIGEIIVSLLFMGSHSAHLIHHSDILGPV